MAAPPDLHAYLVLHRGSRWTDVYRLSPADEVVMGRASTNQIILRSGRASRRHARVFWGHGQTPGWWVEDLASRNGVQLNGQKIDSPQTLSEGDRLEIAGFELRFTRDLANGELNSAESPVDSWQDGVTEGDLSQILESSECLDIVSRSSGDLTLKRPKRSPYDRSRAGDPIPPRAGTDRALLQMAFAMGRAESPDEAAERLLETISEQIPAAEIGLYFDVPAERGSGARLPPPRRVHQRPGHRYRRPPETLLEQAFAPNASSILARNVLGDATLATENTQGEIDVESIILVPLINTESTPHRTSGLIHVTTAADDPSLTDEELSLVVTASEIFGEAIRSLQSQANLRQDLLQTQQTVKRLRAQLTGRSAILGRSDAIREIQRQIVQVAGSGAAVLLRGESGVGKELVASAIHHASPRADQPMVCLNCAALSKDLLESELFGHEQGAFTGATMQKKGKFEAASGGTLMLDEIGEMNLDLQAKLLRVLEGHPFERVGGHESVKVDVRVIAATHRDLQAMVQAGEFRQDLFYRLHVIEIVVPPLRQRGRDIVLLAEHFVKTLSKSMGRRELVLSRAAIEKLMSYPWPGNVRELRNVIERAVVMTPHRDDERPTIDADDLLLAPTRIAGNLPSIDHDPVNSNRASISLAELERQHIVGVLKQTGGNKSQASTILGIERSTLDRKLKRYAKGD
ncbi:sigma 54-interacting transcriptional regulator [Neorhodopirellula pilleata]|uniref:Transcriptional regulatory protein ZraR n=1 Tax=Neorhodopirellula pilleata TaxID=2714738 RepID=A0A5C6AD08_9BACT|nr:sigma 54-interacting transcriptional regulator [Neorhodopirellula pilleata]TWT97499.1 Transcriptional regulatory protein ZraR [Neorhodopirellula pilleata]